jgi:hypothetical protein
MFGINLSVGKLFKPALALAATAFPPVRAALAVAELAKAVPRDLGDLRDWQKAISIAAKVIDR